VLVWWLGVLLGRRILGCCKVVWRFLRLLYEGLEQVQLEDIYPL
jgi:hypothetical protein